ELRRSAPADRERGPPDRRPLPPPPVAHAGPHRPVAGPRPLRDPVRADGEPRLPVRDHLVPLERPEDPDQDLPGGHREPRRLLGTGKGGQKAALSAVAGRSAGKASGLRQYLPAWRK